jgi:hypothetical protein
MAGSVSLVNDPHASVTLFALPSAWRAHAWPSGAPCANCNAEDLYPQRRRLFLGRPAHRRSRARAKLLGAGSSFRQFAQAKTPAFNLSSVRRGNCAASNCRPRRGVLAWWRQTASAVARRPVQLTPKRPPFDRKRNIAILVSCAMTGHALATAAR